MSVRGIGGVFFRSKDPKKLQKWYEDNLGLKPDDRAIVLFLLTARRIRGIDSELVILQVHVENSHPGMIVQSRAGVGLPVWVRR